MLRLVLASMSFLIVGAASGLADDPSKGRQLAQRLCAVCHLNEGQGEKQGPMGLPGFHAIANRPGQNHESLVRWLRSRPPQMPDHHLTWDEADALAAFIMSLRTAKREP